MIKAARWARLLWDHVVAIALLIGMAVGNIRHLRRYLASPLKQKRKKVSS